jgi:UDP-N-acetylmuramate dehydrogenase
MMSLKLDTKWLEKKGIDVKKDAALSNYTTFRLGGTCFYLLTCQKPIQLEDTIFHLVTKKIPFIVIGGGSNLVVSDKGVRAVVVRYFTDESFFTQNKTEVIAAGSVKLDALSLFAAERGLAGLNFAAGIYGTVAGAIVGNAGAFGKQVSDVLKSVVVISRNGKKKEIPASSLKFSYRNSILKQTNDVVLEARLALRPCEKASLLKEREEILLLRHERHPDIRAFPCAGSFFRNLKPSSSAEKRQAAGWFLEQVGAKQLRVGGAGVFEKHANIIVRVSEACAAQDVFDLSRKMAAAVKKEFGITLTREVRLVGSLKGKPQAAGFIW